MSHFNQYLYEKTCEKCQQTGNDDLLLLCDYCDDAYHTFCLSPVLVEVPDADEGKLLKK